MKIGIFGTGIVGRSHAARLVESGYEVIIGTRDIAATLARTERDYMGNEPFAVWLGTNTRVKLGTFAEAASFGEMLINATLGSASLDALSLAGEAGLSGKTLIDISNPLDFSKGMPPSLLVSNTDSLGEQIQRSFPQTRVVKTLNTVTGPLQVNPRQLSDGEHHAFLSGNDAGAKTEVTRLLKEVYGWRHLIDLGDITTARGTEMTLPLWVQLLGLVRSPFFNFRIVGYGEKP